MKKFPALVFLFVLAFGSSIKAFAAIGPNTPPPPSDPWADFLGPIDPVPPTTAPPPSVD